MIREYFGWLGSFHLRKQRNVVRSCAWCIWTGGIIVDTWCNSSGCLGVIHLDKTEELIGTGCGESESVGFVDYCVLDGNEWFLKVALLDFVCCSKFQLKLEHHVLG